MVDQNAFLREHLAGGAPQSVGLGQAMANIATQITPTPRFPGEETYASPEALMAAKVAQRTPAASVPAPTPDLKGLTPISPMAFAGGLGAAGPAAAKAAEVSPAQAFVNRMMEQNIPFNQAVKFAAMMPKPITPVDKARSQFLNLLLAEQDRLTAAGKPEAALASTARNLPAVMAPGAGTAALSPLAMGMGMTDYPQE